MSGYVGSKRSSSLVSATEITLDGAKLKSSGDSITKSDGTTAVLSESGGVVTLNNGTLGANVSFANIADDAISGDKIHSGTISSSTLDGIKLKSSGNSITKSDGTTAVLSESGGVVTLNNGTIGSGVDFSGIANDSISGDKIDGGTATPATLFGSILSSTKLASSGTSIYKSNGSTAVISESGGAATLNNVSLGSDVVFPADHIIQISQNQFNTRVSRTSTSFGVFSSTIGHTITNCKSNSKIYIDLNLSVGASGSASVHCYFRLIDKTNNNAIIGTEGDDGLFGVYIDGQSNVGGYGHSIAKFNYLYTPPSFNNGSFQIEVYGRSHQATMYINRRGFDEAYGRLSSSIVLMEVAG